MRKKGELGVLGLPSILIPRPSLLVQSKPLSRGWGCQSDGRTGGVKHLRAQCAEPWKEARCRRETPCNSRAFLSVVFSFYLRLLPLYYKPVMPHLIQLASLYAWCIAPMACHGAKLGVKKVINGPYRPVLAWGIWRIFRGPKRSILRAFSTNCEYQTIPVCFFGI